MTPDGVARKDFDSRSIPRPLAGEGEGEGKFAKRHPHLCPLPPKEGEEDQEDSQVLTSESLLFRLNVLNGPRTRSGGLNDLNHV